MTKAMHSVPKSFRILMNWIGKIIFSFNVKNFTNTSEYRSSNMIIQQ